jgi:hypothetical protein
MQTPFCVSAKGDNDKKCIDDAIKANNNKKLVKL